MTREIVAEITPSSGAFGLLDNSVGQDESSLADAAVEIGTMSGWRFAGLFAYYVLLSALAALFAAAFATAPIWIWPA